MVGFEFGWYRVRIGVARANEREGLRAPWSVTYLSTVFPIHISCRLVVLGVHVLYRIAVLCILGSSLLYDFLENFVAEMVL